MKTDVKRIVSQFKSFRGLKMHYLLKTDATKYHLYIDHTNKFFIHYSLLLTNFKLPELPENFHIICYLFLGQEHLDARL